MVAHTDAVCSLYGSKSYRDHIKIIPKTNFKSDTKSLPNLFGNYEHRKKHNKKNLRIM